MHRLVPLVVMLVLCPAALMGQEATLARRIVTVTAGIGNAMGWLEQQGERYFARSTLAHSSAGTRLRTREVWGMAGRCLATA